MLHAALVLWTAVVTSQPSSNAAWRWDNQLGLCALHQKVPAGGDLRIAKNIGSDTVSLTYTREMGEKEAGREFQDFDVGIGPAGRFTVEGEVSNASPNSGVSRISVEVPARVFEAAFPMAGVLTLAHSTFGTIEIPVRSTRAAVGALRKCEDDTLSSWKLDRSAWEGLRTSPKPLTKRETWLTTDDYPIRPMMFHAGGSLVAWLNVGADGRVKSCKALNSDVADAFKSTACYALKRRALFSPAIDLSGKPTAAPYIVAIKYRME